MDTDDDEMIVVIIGDDDHIQPNLNFPQPVKIKEEVIDPEYEDDCNTEIDIEKLLKQVEIYGEPLDICIKSEPIDEDEYAPRNDSESDVDYKPVKRKKPERNTKNNVHKKIHIPIKNVALKSATQPKSFVEELRKKYPDLKKNQDKLVGKLVEVMKATRPPQPPDNFCIHTEGTYECVHCAATTFTIPMAARHFQEKHGPRYLKCLACGDDFRSTTNLYKHEKRCSAPDRALVLTARARYLGRKGRSRPFLPPRDEFKIVGGKRRYFNSNNPHRSSRFQCELCPARFTCRVGLEAHRNHHLGLRPFQCDQCVAAYASRTALIRHQQKHTDVQYICDHCGRSFKVKAALVSHMNTHLPERKFACATCGARYAQRSALNIHISSKHLMLPPPCACQICPRRYARMSVLKDHMKRVHGMEIITRKMFFKTLPTLSQTQIEQAKIVTHLDVQNYAITSIDGQNVLEKIPKIEVSVEGPTEVAEVPKVEAETEELQVQTEDGETVELSEDVLNCVKLLQEQGNNNVVLQLIQNEDGVYTEIKISNEEDANDVAEDKSETKIKNEMDNALQESELKNNGGAVKETLCTIPAEETVTELIEEPAESIPNKTSLTTKEMVAGNNSKVSRKRKSVTEEYVRDIKKISMPEID